MIKTRFAPSPTGYLHIGGLRTALYSYLWAKKNNGKYILRIEDTDRTRLVDDSAKSLVSSLNTLGIINDEGPIIKNTKIEEVGDFGPYFQSERLKIYKKYLDKLIKNGKAYYCFCTKERLEKLREKQIENKMTPKYDGHCKSLSKEEIKANLENGLPYTIRMKLEENQDVSFDDIIRGKITINTDDMDEQVLLKADGFPTYHFAVVVDDHLMMVTSVIRGEEWLVSTPKHILLYEYLGFEKPTFAHLPNVLNKDKKKLSKRHDSVAVEDFLKKGYLPEAIINYIAMLGWSDKENREIISMDELKESFDLKRVSKAGAVFDTDKLNWVNSHYIKSKSNDELALLLKPYLNDFVLSEEKLNYLVDLFKDKLNYLAEIEDFTKEVYEKLDEKNINEEMKNVLDIETNNILYDTMISEIDKLDKLTPENINDIFNILTKELKIKGKNLYMPLRTVLNGKLHGPDLKYIMCILGKNEVLNRINFIKTIF